MGNCSGTYRNSKVENINAFKVKLINDTAAQTLIRLNGNFKTVEDDSNFTEWRSHWVQLAGHSESFAPAGPASVWKKMPPGDSNEATVYDHLRHDTVRNDVPRFYRQVRYRGEYYVEIEDLLGHFADPCIMDIKVGGRTFLESEVENAAVRKDLYEKMIKVDPMAPTEEERKLEGITKLRYMQFRENGSSSSSLAFRIDATRMPGEKPVTDLQKVRSRQQVSQTISRFLNENDEVRCKMLERLKTISANFSASPFFKCHEIIGSSLLFFYDKRNNAGVWMIDFAKTLLLPDNKTLTHRNEWVLGNHEDKYLTGLDNLIQIFSDLGKREQNCDDINLKMTE